MFTPYKRRRRNQIHNDTGISGIQIKMKKHEEDSENDQSIVPKEESDWQTIADNIDGSNDYLDSTSQSNNNILIIFKERTIFKSILIIF